MSIVAGIIDIDIVVVFEFVERIRRCVHQGEVEWRVTDMGRCVIGEQGDRAVLLRHQGVRIVPRDTGESRSRACLVICSDCQ